METKSIQEEKQELLELIKKEAYFREKVTLSSGKQSDYYIDARLITLTPRGAYLCARQILDLVDDQDIDAIGGPTLGADPLVGALSLLSLQQGQPLNTFIIRKEEKEHGQGKQIEGPPLNEGSRVLLIDDVATTGKAFLHSLKVLQKLNVKVEKAICLVDREEGAKEAVAEKGCQLISIFKASDIH